MNGLDQPIVLAGDIGGTKTNLGLFARGENRPTMLVMESYSSAHAAGLSELITRFMEAHPQSVSAACFAARFAAAVATANSACAFLYSAVAAFAFAVSVLKL